MNDPLNEKTARQVRKASMLIVLYATVVFFSALTFGFQTDFENKRELIRGLVRSAAMVSIGIWILKLERTAWWFGFISSSVLAAVGILGILLFLVTGFGTDHSTGRLALVLVFPTYCLSHAAWILGQKDVRTSFTK